MKKLSLTETKNIELQLLIKFEQLCENNNLYYTLCGGTLLGAVRHKGFIPWDDDIDVLMPRPDYDKLLAGVDIDYSCLADYEKIIDWKTGTSNFPFIKLVDIRTHVEAEYQNDELFTPNVWIDIFPLDGNPSDNKALNKLYRKVSFFRKLLCIKMAQKGEGKTVLKRFLKPIIINMLNGLSFKYLCEKIDNISKTYDFDSTKYIGGVVWGYGPQERIEKEKYMIAEKMEFEGHLFNVPANYHEYLTGLYDNYMQLPPEDKRVIHGLTVYMDKDI